MNSVVHAFKRPTVDEVYLSLRFRSMIRKVVPAFSILVNTYIILARTKTYAIAEFSPSLNVKR
jgi:hypothetical protein